MAVRGVRGATTLEKDTTEQISARTTELLEQMLTRNSLVHDDLISILFTATSDVHSAFPASAAREIGLGDVPLLCAQELTISGAPPLCVRVLIHAEMTCPRSEVHHIYQYRAVGLRDDLRE
jgi:chorismate mutase